MKKDFTDCNARIYEEESGDLLTTAKILEYNMEELYAVVEDSASLAEVKRCEVLILAAPLPHVYKATVHRHDAGKKIIRLFKGKETEQRGESRYRVDMVGKVKSLLSGGKEHPMHEPMDIQIINISANGMRIRCKTNSFVNGNKFHVEIKIGTEDKILLAEVVNHADILSSDYSYYGCRLSSVDS